MSESNEHHVNWSAAAGTGVGVKPGLWTLDWTVDWTMD